MVGPDSIAAVARAEKVGYIFVLMPGTTCHAFTLLKRRGGVLALNTARRTAVALGGGSGSHIGP